MTPGLRGLALALAAWAAAPGAPQDAGVPPGGWADAGAPDAGPRDPDEELLQHLDEIERLDLLRNLELFDPGGGEGR